MQRKLSYALLIALAAAALNWPAYYNGQPFFHTDTSAYIRGANAGIEKLTGVATEWSLTHAAADAEEASAPAAQATLPVPDVPSPPTASASSKAPETVLAGRSVYYGALLYAGYAAGNFWLTTWIQALMVILACASLLRAYGLDSPTNVSMMTLSLCLTPAAMYSSFLMPDIFGGFTILAVAMLILGPGPRRKIDTTFWFTLLTFALLTHSSNVLICAALWAVAILMYRFCTPRPPLAGYLLAPLALLLAFSGEAAFTAGVRHFLGQAPVRPPFLMARVIGDGPGENYLRANCAHSDLVVCRFVDHLPLTADEFLWLEDPQRGVFAITDPQTRRELSQEQTRFVIRAVASEPWTQIKASLRNTWTQLLAMRASEFTIWSGDKAIFSAKLPRENWISMQASRAYQGTIPVTAFTWMTVLTTVAGALYVLVQLLTARAAVDDKPSPPYRVALLVLLGVLANAVICGSLSEPHNRYQVRVVWLLPVVALLLYLDSRRRRVHAGPRQLQQHRD